MKLADAIKMIPKIRENIRPASSVNYVGVEVEMLSPLDRDGLALIIAQADLGDFINLGTDSSIETDDGDDPEDGGLFGVEARICCKQSEYPKVVKKFFKLITEIGCTVNDSCGLHIHIDARNRDYKKMARNYYACQELLYSVIKRDRRDSEYCEPVGPYIYNLHKDNPIGWGRVGINAGAYTKHKTIEIRIHHSTMNYMDVLQWIALLLSIADAPIIKNGWSLLTNPKYPAPLKTYIKRKVKHYGKWKLPDQDEEEDYYYR